MAITVETLSTVKSALRISTATMDVEITNIVEACKLDLKYAGVNVVDETNPLIKRAIVIYTKAQFGLDNQDSEKYQKSYEMLKNHLSLCGDYNEIV